MGESFCTIFALFHNSTLKEFENGGFILKTPQIFSVHTLPEKFTAPFSNMWTLKFEAQPTNAFFATVNQMLGGSSQPPTTTEGVVIKSLSKVQTTKQCSAVVGSWQEPPNILLTEAKNAFVG